MLFSIQPWIVLLQPLAQLLQVVAVPNLGRLARLATHSFIAITAMAGVTSFRTKTAIATITAIARGTCSEGPQFTVLWSWDSPEASFFMQAT